MRKGILPTAFLAACILVFQTLSAQNTSPYWSLAGNSNASATTSKLGTTNSIPLRFFTNNAERMRLDAANGRLGIGTVNPQQRLHVEGGTLLNIFVSTSPLGATSGAGMIGYTKFLPTAAGHRLGYFLLGSRGGAESNYNAAGMAGYAGDAWTAGSSHPSYLTFETTPSGSTTRQERLRITPSGDVGIGTNSPSNKLHVIGRGRFSDGLSVESGGIYSNYTSGNGVEGYGEPSSYGIGVRAEGYYGMYAIGNGTGVTGFGGETGVYGYSGAGIGGDFQSFSNWALRATTTDGYYAGVFYGNVLTSGSYLTSDQKLKQNIEEVAGAMQIIGKLKPRYYEFTEDKKYAFLNLPKGSHYGLMAQDVEAVLPNLVSTADHEVLNVAKGPGAASSFKNGSPAPSQAAKQKEMVSLKAVNYTELIPIVVKGMQEQQALIEKQAAENEQLMDRIAKLEEMVGKITASQSAPLSLNNASLSQSTPNPASGTTRINYNLPAGTQNARLLLTDNVGRTIRTMPLAGSGSIDIETASLSSGVYHYSLMVDGRRLETRRLTVVR